MGIYNITSDQELSFIHKRRAVRPVIKNGEIIDTSEFYIEVLDREIKNELKRNSKYRFKIGDEICCVIKAKSKLLNMFPEKTIELGGMIENEYIKNQLIGITICNNTCFIGKYKNTSTFC